MIDQGAGSLRTGFLLLKVDTKQINAPKTRFPCPAHLRALIPANLSDAGR